VCRFIHKFDRDEDAIPTDLHQAAHTPFPSNIDDIDDAGLIVEDDDEANSEVKLHRRNVANEMWRSYLDYMADAEASSSDDDILGLGE
jgi:hypothetical protein